MRFIARCVFLYGLLPFWPTFSVDVVEISVELGNGSQDALKWRPGLDDAFLLIEDFVNKNQMERYRRTEIMTDLKVKRAKLAVNSTGAGGSKPSVASMPMMRAMVTREVLEDESAVLALHMGHDASVAVSHKGRVQCVLELERFFNKRYYRPLVGDQQRFEWEWGLALEKVKSDCVCPDGWPSRFTTAVLVYPPLHELDQALLVQMADRTFSIEKWRHVDHHEAHALSAFHSSPFRSALVVSYDSAGNDGYFNVYLGSFDKVKRIAQLDYSMGHAYEQLAMLLPEVTGIPLEEFFTCPENLTTSDELLRPRIFYYQKYPIASLSWAGKLMGYAAVAQPSDALRDSIRFFLEASTAWRGRELTENFPAVLVKTACDSVEGQRVVAATIQSEFESFIHSQVERFVEHVGRNQIEGIVLTGGCALNVLANQRIYDTFSEIGTNGKTASVESLGFYVPPIPNDSGLTVGALWSVEPPKVRRPLQYLGFRLWDEKRLLRAARQRGARRLSSLGGIEYLAELLAGGEVWLKQRNHSAAKPIVAVVRGRQEFGPRALGHRSLLAVADADMKERMNRLKARWLGFARIALFSWIEFGCCRSIETLAVLLKPVANHPMILDPCDLFFFERQWYRPVAPMIAEEALEQVFGRQVPSPFMTMAPAVRSEIREGFPSLVHLDGTARHQSVSWIKRGSSEVVS